MLEIGPGRKTDLRCTPMLIGCPECEKKVSDRAKSCPDCGFPIAEHVAEQRDLDVAEQDRTSRVRAGETDCPACAARGFATDQQTLEDGTTKEVFWWCSMCEHSGRVHLVKSTKGFWAVSNEALEAFVAGAEPTDDTARFVGVEMPELRYPNQPGRFPVEDTSTTD